MFEIQGKYNKLKVFQDKENIEDSCIEQLKLLLEQKFIEGEDNGRYKRVSTNAALCSGICIY